MARLKSVDCSQPGISRRRRGRGFEFLDAAGRKQYLYHERWRARRDQQKFDRMLDFARALPRFRKVAGPREAHLSDGPRAAALWTTVRSRPSRFAL